MFDARAFNIPKEEVTNYIYWRQVDATRNSIQMVGQAYFSHKELNMQIIVFINGNPFNQVCQNHLLGFNISFIKIICPDPDTFAIIR